MELSPFAGKAERYAKYRSDYPDEAIRVLIDRVGLTGDQVVVDLGSGTGLLTRRLFADASLVYAVEPADDMRRAAEEAFAGEPKFRSVSGTAEATGLPGGCADAIVCGNAFHYFDPVRARAEALQILRPGGRVAVLFHDAPRQPNDFTREYLAFLERLASPALRSVHSAAEHERRLSTFFAGRTVTRDEGEQNEPLTWKRLRGLFLSSSFADEGAIPELRSIHDRSAPVTLILGWRCISAAA